MRHSHDDENFSTLLFTWLYTWGFDQWTRYYVEKRIFWMLSSDLDFSVAENALKIAFFMFR
jgi:hypothetical protein